MQTHNSNNSTAGLDGRGLLGALSAERNTGAPAFTSPLVVSKFLPGPRYIATYLLVLPVIVVALASTGQAQLVSGLIAVTWLILSPLALFARWAALLLPIASAVFLCVAVALLDFNSAAFAVDVTIAAAMALVSFPRQWPRESTVAQS